MATKSPSPLRGTPTAAPASSLTAPADAAESVSLQPATRDAIAREDAIRAGRTSCGNRPAARRATERSSGCVRNKR